MQDKATTSFDLPTEYKQMKPFKNTDEIIYSLQHKEDRPLSFNAAEQESARSFFSSTNYFSFTIYRKMLPRLEGKAYCFTDCLDLYHFNSFLRENLNRFTGQIELMFRATLIEQLCTYYEIKKNEDKMHISIEKINIIVELRKRELLSKISKLNISSVSKSKYLHDVDKKLVGSLNSIVELANGLFKRYSKELIEVYEEDSFEYITELEELIQKQTCVGITKIGNACIEILAEEWINDSIFMESVQALLMERMQIFASKLLEGMNKDKSTFVDHLARVEDRNMFRFETGALYKDLAIYKRKEEKHLTEAQEIMSALEQVVLESKSDSILHHRRNQMTIPIWTLIEELTFGNVYRLAVALEPEFMEYWAIHAFNEPFKDFILGWFRTVNFLRNACAHYTRLYGRYFTVSPPRLTKEDANLAQIKADDNKTLFANMLTVKNLLEFQHDCKAEWNIFMDQLSEEIERHSELIQLDKIGFPQNWKTCLSFD